MSRGGESNRKEKSGGMGENILESRGRKNLGIPGTDQHRQRRAKTKAIDKKRET